MEPIPPDSASYCEQGHSEVVRSGRCESDRIKLRWGEPWLSVDLKQLGALDCVHTEPRKTDRLCNGHMCMYTCMCAHTVTDTLQIYCWRKDAGQNWLQMPSELHECCTAHSSGLPQKPIHALTLQDVMLWNLFHMPVASSFRCVNRVKKVAEQSVLLCISFFMNSQYPKVILAHLQRSTLRELRSWPGKCKQTRQTNDNYKHW